jgi:hypothetical protein
MLNFPSFTKQFLPIFITISSAGKSLDQVKNANSNNFIWSFAEVGCSEIWIPVGPRRGDQAAGIFAGNQRRLRPVPLADGHPEHPLVLQRRRRGHDGRRRAPQPLDEAVPGAEHAASRFGQQIM